MENRAMKGKNNKRGSYILEAAIVVPIFIVAAIAIISLIGVFADCEDVIYVAADELKIENIRAAFYQSEIVGPASMMLRFNRSGRRADWVLISNYDYLETDRLMTDTIAVDLLADYSEGHPLIGTFGVSFSAGIKSRAFTGADNSGEGMEPSDFMEDEESVKVYIFPAYGEHYHNEECGFLNPACMQTFLTSRIRNRFSACELCGSEAAMLGDLVYCFFNTGKAYHLPGCNTVEKYYIETEREDAINKGYTPCGSCGG